jgi:hypothetical protein
MTGVRRRKPSAPEGTAVHHGTRSRAGRFVVQPPSEKAMRYSADVSTPSNNVSTDTPSHTVSSLLHFVTQ